MEATDGESALDGLAGFVQRDRRLLGTIYERLYSSTFALTRGSGQTNSRRGPSRVFAAAAVRDAYAALIALGGNDEDLRRACVGEINRQYAAGFTALLGNRDVAARGETRRNLDRSDCEPTESDFDRDASFTRADVDIPGAAWTHHYVGAGTPTDDSTHWIGPDLKRSRAKRHWWRP